MFSYFSFFFFDESHVSLLVVIKPIILASVKQ